MVVWVVTEGHLLPYRLAATVAMASEQVTGRRLVAGVILRLLMAMVSCRSSTRSDPVYVAEHSCFRDVSGSTYSSSAPAYSSMPTSYASRPPASGPARHAHPIRPHQTSPYANPYAAPAATSGYGGYGSGSRGAYGGAGRGGYSGRGRGH
jgi:hypothetical protein